MVSLGISSHIWTRASLSSWAVSGATCQKDWNICPSGVLFDLCQASMGGGQAVISVPCMSWFQTVITCGRPLSSTRRCPGTLQQGLTGSRISSQFGSQVAAASPVEVCSPLDGCVVPRTYLCNLCRVQIFLYIGSKSQNFNWLDAILRFKCYFHIFWVVYVFFPEKNI